MLVVKQGLKNAGSKTKPPLQERLSSNLRPSDAPRLDRYPGFKFSIHPNTYCICNHNHMHISGISGDRYKTNSCDIWLNHFSRSLVTMIWPIKSLFLPFPLWFLRGKASPVFPEPVTGCKNPWFSHKFPTEFPWIPTYWFCQNHGFPWRVSQQIQVLLIKCPLYHQSWQVNHHVWWLNHHFCW